MLLPHIGAPVLLPEEKFKDFQMPEVEAVNHYHQFVDAVLGNGQDVRRIRILRTADGDCAAGTARHEVPANHAGMEFSEDEV